MSRDVHDANRWDACSPGELSRLAADLAARRRSRRAAPILSGLVMGGLLLGTLAAVFYWLPSGGAPQAPEVQPPVHLVCADVLPLLSKFKSTELDSEVMQQVTDHLQGCRSCRAAFEAMAGRAVDQDLCLVFFRQPRGIVSMPSR